MIIMIEPDASAGGMRNEEMSSVGDRNKDGRINGSYYQRMDKFAVVGEVCCRGRGGCQKLD